MAKRRRDRDALNNCVIGVPAQAGDPGVRGLLDVRLRGCVKTPQTGEILEPRTLRVGRGRWAVPTRDWLPCRAEIRVGTLRCSPCDAFSHSLLRRHDGSSEYPWPLTRG